MNQILLTENNNNKKKNINKSTSKSTSRTNSNDLKKIIAFFSVVILIFGVAIGGVYGYRLLKNSNKEEQKVSDTELSIPELDNNAENVEYITITAKSGVGINKIIYTWNDDEPIEIELNETPEYQEQIEVPVGENTLKVVIIDKNGKEIEKTGTVTREGEVEEAPVEIETSILYVGNVKKVKISGESTSALNKVIYEWSGQEEETIELNGNVSFEEEIEIPYGESDLKIKVIDLEQRVKEQTETFTREEIEINTSVVEENGVKKAKVNIISKSPLVEVTYSWNSEQETNIEVGTQKLDLETTIELKRGNNILTITAKNTDNETKTIDREFNGVLKPEIQVYKQGDRLYMKMSHDKGFKSIQFYVNGQTRVYDENHEDYDENKKEIEYYFTLKEGENIVIIKAISTEETEAIYKGKCNYTAQ